MVEQCARVIQLVTGISDIWVEAEVLPLSLSGCFSHSFSHPASFLLFLSPSVSLSLFPLSPQMGEQEQGGLSWPNVLWFTSLV